MVNFKNTIEAQITHTKEIVREGWEELVQCEKDHPCCTVNESTYKNIIIQIHTTKVEITRLTELKEEYRRKQREILERCPNAATF